MTNSERQVKVLVVEDSPTVRMLLVQVLNSDPGVRVIGTANNGREALQFMERASPDVVLMDIEMPEMDGFETTRRIMETQPVPIVICGGSDDTRAAVTSFRLLEAGAVACLDKPVGSNHDDFAAKAAYLLQTVKLMSEVKVVRRWSKLRPQGKGKETEEPVVLKQPRTKVDVIGIGASTGGPPVLQMILAGLPKDFSVPLLIVQHIAPGFLPGLVEWLTQTTGFDVQIATHGVQALGGRAYLAPDDFHMKIGAGRRIVLNRESRENSLRPSVDQLFRSLAEVCGPSAVGVLLTGMGKDGAVELKEMKDRGAVTIAQDQATAVIHGMPGEAIAMGGATYVLPSDGIASALVALVNQRPLPGGAQK